MREGLRVFAWHNVEGSWCFPCRPGAGARGIERQLRFLRRVANVVPLREALQALRKGRPLPARAVAITFDDGYRDTLDFAAPLLERLALPATFFLVPGLLSGSIQAWWELLGWAFARASCDVILWEGKQFSLRDAAERRASYQKISERLKRRDRRARDQAVEQLTEILDPTGSPGDLFFDWDGARGLVSRGFTVGSHTMYHAILTQETSEEQQRDLEQSRRLLEDGLGVAVDLLAYPNGTQLDYDSATFAAARNAGYSHGFTLLKGPNVSETPPYELGRYLMYSHRGVRGFANVVPLAVKGYRTVKAATLRP